MSARSRHRCRPGLPNAPAIAVPSASPPLHGPERARPPPFDGISGDPILRVEMRSLAAPGPTGLRLAAGIESLRPILSGRTAPEATARPASAPTGTQRATGTAAAPGGRPDGTCRPSFGAGRPAEEPVTRGEVRDRARTDQPAHVPAAPPLVGADPVDGHVGRADGRTGLSRRPAAASVERAPGGAFAEREISPISGARRAGAAYGRDDAKWGAAGEALLQRLDRRACDAGPVPAGGDARAGVQEPGVALERGTGMAFRRGRWRAPASPQPPFAAAAATLPATGTGPKRRRDR